MGYCTQYNLALQHILDRLGYGTIAVSSLQIRVQDDRIWTPGHTWPRVTIDGETKDVCAGRADSVP